MGEEPLKRIIIFINGIPPSNNKYMGNSHNYNIYKEEKKHWENIVIQAAKPYIPEIPYKKSIIKIFYHFKDNRKRDPDNYCGKFILDGLKKSGMIEDDSFKHIKLALAADFKKVAYDTTEIIIIKIR